MDYAAPTSIPPEVQDFLRRWTQRHRKWVQYPILYPVPWGQTNATERPRQTAGRLSKSREKTHQQLLLR